MTRHANEVKLRSTVLIWALVLAGYVGSTEATNTSGLTINWKTQALEKEDKLPVQDRSGTLAGVDANTNGVRDDIDLFIKKSYGDQDQQRAATQYAAALQNALVVDFLNRDASLAASLKITRSIRCLAAKFVGGPGKDSGSVVREIESFTTNTKLRLQAYLNFNKAIAGSVISWPQGSTCE